MILSSTSFYNTNKYVDRHILKNIIPKYQFVLILHWGGVLDHESCAYNTP